MRWELYVLLMVYYLIAVSSVKTGTIPLTRPHINDLYRSGVRYIMT